MMRKQVGRWAVMAVALPLAAVGARKIGQSMETRRGSTRTSRLLRRSADMIRPQRTSRRRWLRWS